MKVRKPSAGTVLGTVAIGLALTGGADAAGVIHLGKGVVHSRNIANGAVGNKQLSKSVNRQLRKVGAPGRAGKNGMNPATAVVRVTPLTSTGGGVDKNNKNSDSGTPGDSGWYFTGYGSGGSAMFTDGQLELTGPGIDGNTFQGGIGIAKAYHNVPLSSLTALAYNYTVYTPNGDQTPSVYVTLDGATNDSHFKSGFTNLELAPALNGVTSASAGVDYTADGFTQSAKWYSSDEPDISSPGGQNDPQPLSYFVKNDPNAVIDQITLGNGGTSGNNGNPFDAVANGLLIGLKGVNTRYDFGG